MSGESVFMLRTRGKEEDRIDVKVGGRERAESK